MNDLSPTHRRRARLADAVLAALVLGPPAAPLLAAWGLLVPRLVSDTIYTMGAFVCPQPAYGPVLYDGWIMAVCMRCYGTVLGLLITRLLYAVDGGAGRYWLIHMGLRALPVFAALIFVYPAEYAGQVAGLWGFDHGITTLAGLITGGGLGLLFHPVLQGNHSPRIADSR